MLHENNKTNHNNNHTSNILKSSVYMNKDVKNPAPVVIIAILPAHDENLMPTTIPGDAAEPSSSTSSSCSKIIT